MAQLCWTIGFNHTQLYKHDFCVDERQHLGLAAINSFGMLKNMDSYIRPALENRGVYACAQRGNVQWIVGLCGESRRWSSYLLR